MHGNRIWNKTKSIQDQIKVTGNETADENETKVHEIKSGHFINKTDCSCPKITNAELQIQINNLAHVIRYNRVCTKKFHNIFSK